MQQKKGPIAGAPGPGARPSRPWRPACNQQAVRPGKSLGLHVEGGDHVGNIPCHDDDAPCCCNRSKTTFCAALSLPLALFTSMASMRPPGRQAVISGQPTADAFLCRRLPSCPITRLESVTEKGIRLSARSSQMAAGILTSDACLLNASALISVHNSSTTQYTKAG